MKFKVSLQGILDLLQKMHFVIGLLLSGLMTVATLLSAEKHTPSSTETFSKLLTISQEVKVSESIFTTRLQPETLLKMALKCIYTPSILRFACCFRLASHLNYHNEGSCDSTLLATPDNLKYSPITAAHDSFKWETGKEWIARSAANHSTTKSGNRRRFESDLVSYTNSPPFCANCLSLVEEHIKEKNRILKIHKARFFFKLPVKITV
jgi:hypothetical protein